MSNTPKLRALDLVSLLVQHHDDGQVSFALLNSEGKVTHHYGVCFDQCKGKVIPAETLLCMVEKFASVLRREINTGV